MEDLTAVKLSDAERARAKAISRRLASVGLLIFLTIPISLIVTLMLRGKISSFNSTVDSYVMPALHNVSPGLWRFINYGFTTDMRYSAEYLLVAWLTSGVLALVAGAILISAFRQMDLNYFIFNAQVRNKPTRGLGFEFMLLLGGSGLRSLSSFHHARGRFRFSL